MPICVSFTASNPHNKKGLFKALEDFFRLGYNICCNAGIAQLVEQLNRNQHVGGSSPLAGSSKGPGDLPGSFIFKLQNYLSYFSLYTYAKLHLKTDSLILT